MLEAAGPYLWSRCLGMRQAPTTLRAPTNTLPSAPRSAHGHSHLQPAALTKQVCMTTSNQTTMVVMAVMMVMTVMTAGLTCTIFLCLISLWTP